MSADHMTTLPASQQVLVVTAIVLLSSCCHANDPPAKKVRSPNDPDIDQGTVYLKEGENFERNCMIRGGKEGGPPRLQFIDDESLPVNNNPPRTIIIIKRDQANNLTMGVFRLQPANVEDNAYKTIICRNADAGRSLGFKLKIIPKASIPAIRILENGSVAVKQGTSRTITCSLNAQAGADVTRFNVTWTTGDLKSASCGKGSVLPAGATLEKVKTNSTSVISQVRILNPSCQHSTKFYCVACLYFKDSTSFDTVKKYSDYVDIDYSDYLDNDVTAASTSVEEVRYVVKDNITLDCKAVYCVDARPNVTWYRKDWVVLGGPDAGEEVPMPKDSRYSFGESETKGTHLSAPQSVLKIAGVTLSDRAQYVCRKQFFNESVTAVFQLRISDPRSGWYAVIGMVVEAILIIIIILATGYYKRCKEKRNDPEKAVEAVWSATDGSPAEEDTLMSSDRTTSTARVST